MTDNMRRLCRHRLLALIRINGLLRNARRLKKANQSDRVKLFVREAKETIEAFIDYSPSSDLNVGEKSR